MTVRPLGPDLVLVGFEPSRHLEPVAAIVPSRERLVFADVYAAHFDLVWRSLRHLGVPERLLDDAVQDVWLIVHRKLDEFDGVITSAAPKLLAVLQTMPKRVALLKIHFT